MKANFVLFSGCWKVPPTWPHIRCRRRRHHSLQVQRWSWSDSSKEKVNSRLSKPSPNYFNIYTTNCYFISNISATKKVIWEICILQPKMASKLQVQRAFDNPK
jgi:hypothetical protein